MEVKKFPKWFLILLILVPVVLALAGAAAFLLIPKKQEVYVMTGRTVTRADGTEYVQKFRYDDTGLPLFQANQIGYYYARDTKVQYNEYGDPVELTKDEGGLKFHIPYEHTYEDGKLQSTCIWDNEEWVYTWDEEGKLTSVMKIDDGTYHLFRMDLEYDSYGRLEREYQVDSYSDKEVIAFLRIRYVDYGYDEAGRPICYRRHDSGDIPLTDRPDFDYSDPDYGSFDFEESLSTTISYDQEGRVCHVVTEYSDGQVTEKHMDYDRYGDPDLSVCFADYGFDENGDLLYTVTEYGERIDYSYKLMKIPVRDLARHERWMSLSRLDPVDLYLFSTHPLLGGFEFFYYLVPNPIW